MGFQLRDEMVKKNYALEHWKTSEIIKQNYKDI